MKKRMLFGLGIIIVFAVSLISPVIASAPRTEAWYTFQLHPFADIIHLNTNPGGWLNGYDEAYPYPEGSILGKYESGKAYLACDLPAGGFEMFFLVITISTRDGYMMRISDDYSITGPEYVWLTTTTSTESTEGPTTDEAAGPLVTPAAWYAFTINPWIDTVHLDTNLAPWLHGWQEPYTPIDAPVLGYYSAGRFFFATDFPDGETYYELAFEAGTLSTRDGYVIRTTDGNSYDGPEYFWLS